MRSTRPGGRAVAARIQRPAPDRARSAGPTPQGGTREQSGRSEVVEAIRTGRDLGVLPEPGISDVDENNGMGS